jgi:hypothetical protein
VTFRRAQAIADAVLLEGYVLYPYRHSSAKNRYRWTFGVLAPRAWSEPGGCEPWWLEAQVLVASDAPRLRARLRFLHVVDRRVEAASPSGELHRVERLEVDGQPYVSFEEADAREIDFDVTGEHAVSFLSPAREDVETIRDGSGGLAGRIVRTRAEIRGVIRTRVERVDGLARVHVRVENLTAHPPGAPRGEAMLASCVSTHLLLADDRGGFVSLLDPPAGAERAARACKSTGVYPVIASEEGRRDLVLCSPIILPDHPRVAPESPGDFFDSGEIDELLALRTRTLTPEEKQLARATDRRAAALLDRVEALDHEALARLHGAIRDRPKPRFAPGSRVRLRPSRAGRRTDAQDLLYEGLVATVHRVLDDVDGSQFLAVTIDADPAAELHLLKGRFHQYHVDEVEPFEEDAPADPLERAPLAGEESA